MHKYLFIFAIVFFGCTNEASNSNNSLTIEALQKAAMKQYMDSPVSALPNMEKLADLYAEKQDYKAASETYFNISTIYDETLNDKKKALVQGQKSLDNAVLAKDEKQQADMLKHNGYLRGLNGDTKMGKKDLVDAMLKYKTLNDDAGAASAQFNLSRVFYMEGALEESAHFLIKSMQHLRTANDAKTIFHNNLFAISLFRKMEKPEMVQEAIEENNSLIPAIKYEGYIKQEFERLVKDLK